jgi:hypothetical protein
VADQAGRDQVGDSADGVGQGDLRVRKVRVIEVDSLDVEVSQAIRGIVVYVRWVGVDRELAEGVIDSEPVCRGALGDAEAKLGGDHDAGGVAALAQGPADEPLVVAVGAVAVAGIEESRASVEGGM